MIYYLVAIFAGLLLGSLAAFLKYIFLWRPYAQGRFSNVTVCMMISSCINVVVLLAIFLFRNLWPYSFSVTLLSAAVSLSLGGKLGAKQVSKRV